MKVSFLCDRDTTGIAGAQGGFCKFGPLPLFKVLTQFTPSKIEIVRRLEKSAESWEQIAIDERAKRDA